MNFRTKTSLITDNIRRRIIEGELKPGDRLQEEQIAEQQDVSTTPVREALYQLEAEGLVSRIPHRGVVITVLSIEDLNELVTLQVALQSMVVRMNFSKLTPEEIAEARNLHNEMKRCYENHQFAEMRWLDYKFHMLLCGEKRVPWITRVISGLWVHFPNKGYEEVPGFAETSIKHHSQIVNCMEKKESKLLINIIKDHFSLERISPRVS
jgi:DNA-binding GntR family transcriptional regulator